ncbi:hypothetical protein Pan216_13370 [Planctomycetes bacterium Pan216]|uniref:Uncharacterized protein n=1 Tax=Kolteria novifilia TaxID=2527975 RepID=A0A518B0J9_9BACT|nr:hypothetical protein Pan216_13370 [Planctomycetes bacterium Pan216]
MMDDQTFESALNAWWDERDHLKDPSGLESLPEELRREIDRDPQRRDDALAWIGLARRVSSLPKPAVPGDFADRILAQLPTKAPRRRGPGTRRFVAVIGAVAAVAACLLVVVALTSSPDSAPSDVAVVPPETRPGDGPPETLEPEMLVVDLRQTGATYSKAFWELVESPLGTEDSSSATEREDDHPEATALFVAPGALDELLKETSGNAERVRAKMSQRLAPVRETTFSAFSFLGVGAPQVPEEPTI